MTRWIQRLGLAVLVALGACATAGTGAEGSRDIITEEEIRNSSASNAYQLVAALRPQWLRVRGTQNVPGKVGSEGTGAGVGEALGQEIVIYLDNARLGGSAALQQIALGSVRYLRRYDAAAANYRWGAGHSHGVIFVSTQPLQ